MQLLAFLARFRTVTPPRYGSANGTDSSNLLPFQRLRAPQRSCGSDPVCPPLAPRKRLLWPQLSLARFAARSWSDDSAVKLQHTDTF